eukprot:1874558-Lingulodinium_polyedra.AAC.1
MSKVKDEVGPSFMAGTVLAGFAGAGTGISFGGGTASFPGSVLLELAVADRKVSEMMVLIPSPYSSPACLLA